MTDYRAVMKLLVQQRSYRQIEQQGVRKFVCEALI